MRASQLSPHNHDKCVNKLLHQFDNLPAQVAKSLYCSQDSEYEENRLHNVWGLRLPQTYLSQKSPPF